MKIKFYANTAQGKRPRQEDNFTILDFPTTGQQIAAVADGMGGHPKGAEASCAAISPLQQLFGSTAFRSGEEVAKEMRRVMRMADDAVAGALSFFYEQLLRQLGFTETADIGNYRHGPGSTLTVVAAHPDAPYQLVLGHIGDSRAYLLRQREEDGALGIKQLTRDHSEGPYIDRALGNWDSDRSVRSNWQLDENGKPTPYDVSIVKVRTGDMILLCSDGIHGVLSDQQILSALHAPFHLSHEGLPAAVVRDALNAGSSDNCTVVLGVVES